MLSAIVHKEKVSPYVSISFRPLCSILSGTRPVFHPSLCWSGQAHHYLSLLPPWFCPLSEWSRTSFHSRKRRRNTHGPQIFYTSSTTAHLCSCRPEWPSNKHCWQTAFFPQSHQESFLACSSHIPESWISPQRGICTLVHRWHKVLQIFLLPHTCLSTTNLQFWCAASFPNFLLDWDKPEVFGPTWSCISDAPSLRGSPTRDPMFLFPRKQTSCAAIICHSWWASSLSSRKHRLKSERAFDTFEHRFPSNPDISRKKIAISNPCMSWLSSICFCNMPRPRFVESSWCPHWRWTTRIFSPCLAKKLSFCYPTPNVSSTVASSLLVHADSWYCRFLPHASACIPSGFCLLFQPKNNTSHVTQLAAAVNLLVLFLLFQTKNDPSRIPLRHHRHQPRWSCNSWSLSLAQHPVSAETPFYTLLHLFMRQWSPCPLTLSFHHLGSSLKRHVDS